jgi:hypothetical protein
VSSRLDNTQDNGTITEIKSLQADIAELKSRQSVGHGSVTHGYIGQSPNAFDVSAYAIPANTTHSFWITFTGDGSQPAPYGVQFSAVYNNGTDAAHRLSDYVMYDSTNTYYNWGLSSAGGTPSAPTLTWFVNVNAGASGASVYIKFRISTTGKGSWNASW